MNNWDFSPPSKHDLLKDTDLKSQSDVLQGRNIALLITGSISAFQTPQLIRFLRKQGANIKVFISNNALQFVTQMSLEWSSNNKVISKISHQTEHLDNFDSFLVIPASYNIINKFNHGIADEIISITLAGALGQMENNLCKIYIAPCMYGSMHNSILKSSLKTLQSKGINIIKPLQENYKNKLPSEKYILNCIKK